MSWPLTVLYGVSRILKFSNLAESVPGPKYSILSEKRDRKVEAGVYEHSTWRVIGRVIDGK